MESVLAITILPDLHLRGRGFIGGEGFHLELLLDNLRKPYTNPSHPLTLKQSAYDPLGRFFSAMYTQYDVFKTLVLFSSAAVVEDRGSEYRGQVRALQDRVRELENAQQAHVTASSHAAQKLSSDRGAAYTALLVESLGNETTLHVSHCGCLKGK